MFGAWASIRFIWMLYRGQEDVFFFNAFHGLDVFGEMQCRRDRKSVV